MAEERLTDEPAKLDDPDPKPEIELPKPERKELVLPDEAQKEYERIMKAGRRKLRAGEYADAEKLFAQAAFSGDTEAEIALWEARTHGYTDAACFGRRRMALRFARSSEEVRASVLSQMGEAFARERAQCEEQAEPLRARVEEGMASRRGAFAANRNYWLLRFAIVFAVTLLFAVGCAVAAVFIVRTRGIFVPVLTAVLGGVALLFLIAALVLLHKVFVAQGYVRDNERLSSTEEGEELEGLLERIELLTLLLEGEREEEEA